MASDFTALALRILAAKQDTPSLMGSFDWRQLAADVRRRALFSARLERATVLQQLRKDLELILSGGTDGDGRLRSLAEAKARLKEAMLKAGVPAAPEGTPPVQDFYSDERRALIVETNLADIRGAARAMRGAAPLALEMNPAWELVRMTKPKGRERDWPQRWADAGGEFYGGRMIALKNSPVWQRLGDGDGGYEDTLGNPWPPFAFWSGMDTIEVPRAECAALGVMDADDEIEPPDLPGLNDSLAAGVKTLDPDLRAALLEGWNKDWLRVTVSGGVARVQNRDIVLNTFAGTWHRDERGRFASADSGGGGGADGEKKSPVVWKQKPEIRAERQRRVKDIRAGRAAVHEGLREKKDMNDVMRVRGLGSIDFDYGRPGTANPRKFEDGYGLAHMQAQHAKDLPFMPRTLALGKIYPHDKDDKKRFVVHGDYVAVLKKKELHPRGEGKFSGSRWGVVTHYKAAEQTAAIESGRIYAKQKAAAKNRDGLDTRQASSGGVLPPATTQPVSPMWFHRKGAAKDATIAQLRARVKLFATALQIRNRVKKLQAEGLLS